jgi:hypothetical protein
MSLKEKIEEKMLASATEAAAIKPKVEERTTDPELDAARARVEKGELAAAFRTRNGALVVTHKSDPENSPAAPASSSSGMGA